MLITFLKEQQAIAIVDYARSKQCQNIRQRTKKEEDKQLTLELIKIQDKENANLAQYLDNLAQYVEFPYEYWHQSYTPDLETLYFDDIQQLEPLPSLLSIIEPIPQSMLLSQITPIYENEPF